MVSKLNFSSSKVWIVVGISVAGVLILAEARRRLKRGGGAPIVAKDFGAFVERFEILPSPQPPPPAARQLLAGLKFAVKDVFDVKEYVTGFGNPEWRETHEAASKSAVAVSLLLKNGATCVGKTVMDEFSFGISGENVHYGTPNNPKLPSFIPGGSSSGSAVAVAAGIVDFSLGTDIVGDVRIPAAYCGIFGYRPSHGVVSSIGILPNSQSLETVGWFARDPSVLRLLGNVLLQASSAEPRRTRRLMFADDCFQFYKVPKHKTYNVIRKAAEGLSGYQSPKNMNISEHVSSDVPCLKEFKEALASKQNGIANLKRLSSAMLLLQRYEFKTNYEEWFKKMKPKLGPDAYDHVLGAVNSTVENAKSLYKVRTEMRIALNNLLKNDGILIIPSIPDFPHKLKGKKKSPTDYQERAFSLLSIATLSGCCQTTIPLGEHDGYPISVSFIAAHGADRFLLDTVSDMYSSLQEQVTIACNSVPVRDTDGDMATSELLKEKGNAAFKGKQWNKAVNFYTEAIKLSSNSATYYCNRAAAYLELGCFQQAEEDCTTAISLDKKSVKAYLRRGTAREMLLYYREAAQDFKHALVLEPQNKAALNAEKRLRKLAA